MRELRDQVALVTGASSGIGAAVALKLAEHKVHLALIARDTTRLEAVAVRARTNRVTARAYVADLAREEDINSLKAAVDDEFGKLDMLIHCAGIFERGPVEEADAEMLLRLFRVNTLAPYALTHLFLPAIKRRRGQIVFINSSAGIQAYPNMTQYAATKAALRVIADGLREEVGRDGVRVLSVFPGRIATPLQHRIQTLAGRRFDTSQLPQPEDVASLVLAALTMPPNTEITDIIVRPQQDPYM